MLVDRIGEPAMLELLAEECAELAQASLKYARYLRRENPTFKDFSKINDNYHEELADVLICIEELQDAGVITPAYVSDWITRKKNRMRDRFSDD